jgi:hypothetical protein
VNQKPAGPQGIISSRTTLAAWLSAHPREKEFYQKQGEPIGFGCDICTALNFNTLEEAVGHVKEENKTVRSIHWKHAVTINVKQTYYLIDAADIIGAPQLAKEVKKIETDAALSRKIRAELHSEIRAEMPNWDGS